MMHDPTFWILARAAGFTAYILLALSVLAGIVLKSRPFGNRLKPATVTDTHRTLAMLGLGALMIHSTALVFDATVAMPVSALFVPGLSPYRPLWVGLGVLTAELMIVVYASFSLRRRIGVKNWRRLHWATYLIFVLATAHGLAAGTDSTRTWALVIYLGAIASVAAAATWRFLAPLTENSKKGESRVSDRGRPAVV
jgi:predicted ferric reductase